jgi:hypothetical protein
LYAALISASDATFAPTPKTEWKKSSSFEKEPVIDAVKPIAVHQQ